MRHDITSKTDFRTIYDGTADEEALVRKILPEVPWVEFILKSMNMSRDKIKEREIYKEKRNLAFHLKWRKCFKQEKRRGGEKSVHCEGKFLRGHVATTYLTSPPETITTLLFDYMCMLSHFSHVWLFESLWTVAHQAPLFMGFSRQEY